MQVRRPREPVVTTVDPVASRGSASLKPLRRPVWTTRNLKQHHDKHPGGKDTDCWKDLLDKQSLVSIEEYGAASDQVIDQHWLEYEGESFDSYATGYYGQAEYRENRAQYVDDRELVVVASQDRVTIISCFHEHYGRRHRPGRHKNTPVGERRNDFKKQLRDREQGGMIRKLRIVRDETA